MTALPEDVTALLRAVHDALDLPSPAATPVDIEEHGRVLEARASDARIILASVLKAGLTADPAAAAGQLTGWIAERPVTYTPYTLPDPAP